MNGAMAELCANTISAPIKNRHTIIGTSHHRFRLQKNVINSPATPRLPRGISNHLHCFLSVICFEEIILLPLFL